MVGAFFVMLASFWAEEVLVNIKKQQGLEADGPLILLPSITYSAVVYIMNWYYRKLATFLTEWGK
jgi:anoctamin-10